MASKDLLKYVNEQVLECAICMDKFKHPKTLPCLHVFCSDCIGTHIDKTTKRGYYNYNCPTCKEVHDIRSAGKTKLRDGFLQKSLLEIASLVQKEPVSCSSCAGNKDAVSACPTCGEFFCAACETSHGTVPLTRTHTLYPISELSDVTKLAKFQKSRYALCAVHHAESCKLFCNHASCQIQICHICTYERKHKDHSVVPLEEKLEEYTKEINKTLPTVNSNLQQLSAQKKMLEDIRNGIARTETEAVQNFEKRLKEIFEMLETYKREVTQRIKLESENQQKPVNALLKTINSDIQRYEKHAGVGNHLNKIAVASAIQVAKDVIPSLDKIKPVNPIDIPQVKAESSGVRFLPATLNFNSIKPTFKSMLGAFPPIVRVNKEAEDIHTDMSEYMQASLTAAIKDALWNNRDMNRNADDSFEQLGYFIQSHMMYKHGGYWNCAVGTLNQYHLTRMHTERLFFSCTIDGLRITLCGTPGWWWHIFG